MQTPHAQQKKKKNKKSRLDLLLLERKCVVSDFISPYLHERHQGIDQGGEDGVQGVAVVFQSHAKASLELRHVDVLGDVHHVFTLRVHLKNPGRGGGGKSRGCGRRMSEKIEWRWLTNGHFPPGVGWAEVGTPRLWEKKKKGQRGTVLVLYYTAWRGRSRTHARVGCEDATRVTKGTDDHAGERVR